MLIDGLGALIHLLIGRSDGGRRRPAIEFLEEDEVEEEKEG